MIKPKQLQRWICVFILMSVFSLLQVPITEVAMGGILENKYKKVWLENEPAYLEQSVYSNLHVIKEYDTSPIYDSSIENNVIDKAKEQYNKDFTEKEEGTDIGRTSSLNIERASNFSNEKTYKKESQNDGIKDSKNNKKAIYLTIDDGPGPVSEQILDILAQYDVKATFFLLEPRVYAYPQMVKRMAEEGHELGVHGVTHEVKRFYASADSVVTEFRLTRNAIKDVTTRDVLFARTPYGSHPHLTQSQDQAIADAGYRLWDWNVDSRDWYYASQNYVQHTIKQVDELADRGVEPIILIHELKSTATHLSVLIEHLLEQDYEFKILDAQANPVRLRTW